MKRHQVGAESFQVDRHDVAFHNFTTAPNYLTTFDEICLWLVDIFHYLVLQKTRHSVTVCHLSMATDS